MQSRLLFCGVASIGLVLAVAACSASDGTTGAAPGGEDAGSSGSSGKRPGSSGSTDTDDDDDDDNNPPGKKDGGTSSSGGLKSTTLSQGDQQLFAIAVDDAIYLEFGQTTNTLYAVPIDGSAAPTKIADLGEDDDFLVSGGAVAVWTNIDDNGFGTLGVWTRATGLKNNIATASGAGAFFAASEDGSRIAFTQDLALDGEDITSLEIGVRDTAAATNAATLEGTTAAGNAFNFAAQDCSPSMGFAGKVFFAQFCSGTAANATNAKLVTVAANGTTVVRLDADTNGAAGTLKASPAFVASDDGTKVFVVRSTNSAGRFITVGGAAGGTALENDVSSGTMLPDGSAVIYRTTGNVLKKATTAATPVITTLAPADAKGLLFLSPDGKNVLFHKLDPEDGNPLIDVSTVDHTAAAPAPVALVPTLEAFPLGVNGASSHLVFIGDLTQTSAKLKSMPIAGGTAKTLGDSVGALLATTGTGAVSVSNPKPAPDPYQFDISDITHYDTVTGNSSKIADSVPDGEIQVKGKRVVYSRFAPQGSGIYAVTLP